MNEKLTELVMILDRSGSMRGLEEDTIGGFNSMIDKQKEFEGDVTVSTVLFNHYTKVTHDRVSIQEIEPMTGEDYFVGGSTALLDAVGGAIHHIKNVHKYAREEDRPAKTVFVITTDGMENASRLYTYNKVKRMVEEQQEKDGWEFIFLGANIDAIRTAGRFGIRADRAARYRNDKDGISLNYKTVSDAVKKIRYSEELDESWKKDIEDHEKGGNGGSMKS